MGLIRAARVLLATRPVDFRNGMDGSATLATAQLGGDPFSSVVYVFRAKKAHRVKLARWDGTGLCLMAKKLEAGACSWLAVHDGPIRLTAAQLGWLLEGLDWRRVHQARHTGAQQVERGRPHDSTNSRTSTVPPAS
jgi:transposase